MVKEVWKSLLAFSDCFYYCFRVYRDSLLDSGLALLLLLSRVFRVSRQPHGLSKETAFWIHSWYPPSQEKWQKSSPCPPATLDGKHNGKQGKGGSCSRCIVCLAGGCGEKTVVSFNHWFIGGFRYKNHWFAKAGKETMVFFPQQKKRTYGEVRASSRW